MKVDAAHLALEVGDPRPWRRERGLVGVEPHVDGDLGRVVALAQALVAGGRGQGCHPMRTHPAGAARPPAPAVAPARGAPLARAPPSGPPTWAALREAAHPH